MTKLSRLLVHRPAPDAEFDGCRIESRRGCADTNRTVLTLTSRNHRSARAAAVAAACAAAFAAAAPAAVANVRWADPAASAGAACTAGDPCRLDTAVNGASAGDEVVLRPGTYTVSYTVDAPAAIDVHGEAGEDVPRLIGTSGLGRATITMRNGGTISRVWASGSVPSAAVFALQGVIADGIEAFATGSAYGIEPYSSAAGTILRNSVARVDGGGAAVQVKEGAAGSTTILGVTAIGTGGADAIVVKSTLSSTTVKNTIARGSSWDIEKKPTAVAPLVSYSNFRPENALNISAGLGNQSGTPLLVDAANSDVRQLAGSPTIDAGEADALAGAKDGRGGLRTIGTATDIGAMEFDPAAPPVTGGGGTGGGSGSGSGDSSTGTSGGSTGGETPSGADDGSAGETPAPLPPETKPVLGASVTLGGVKGRPLVRLPGSAGFTPLTDDSTVPVGAVVDTTRGTVALTSVRDATGQTQTGTFWGGVFRVGQSRTDTVTELALTGSSFTGCPTKPRRRRAKVVAAGRRHTATVRRLWGRDRGGRFRTRGRHGSATVRGTRWLTADRCDGTLFKVTEGAIAVRDDRARRTVQLKRGASYLARPHDPARKKRRSRR